MNDKELFKKAYIECMLWASIDINDVPFDHHTAQRRISSELAEQIEKDCSAFFTDNGNLIAPDPGQAGYDFWLTRNGHGSGFWDGDWPEPIATELTNASNAFGEFDIYEGDDRLIYGR